MAVRVIKEVVCDLCGSGDEVRRFRVTRANGTVKTVSPDLCAEHSAVLDEMFKKLPKGKRGQVAPHRVVTEKQVRAARRKRA